MSLGSGRASTFHRRYKLHLSVSVGGDDLEEVLQSIVCVERLQTTKASGLRVRRQSQPIPARVQRPGAGRPSGFHTRTLTSERTSTARLHLWALTVSGCDVRSFMRSAGKLRKIRLSSGTKEREICWCSFWYQWWQTMDFLVVIIFRLMMSGLWQRLKEAPEAIHVSSRILLLFY